MSLYSYKNFTVQFIKNRDLMRQQQSFAHIEYTKLIYIQKYPVEVNIKIVQLTLSYNCRIINLWPRFSIVILLWTIYIYNINKQRNLKQK